MRAPVSQDRTGQRRDTSNSEIANKGGGEKNKMEVMRQEDVERLETAIVKKLEERINATLHQSAVDAAKTVMNQVRLDLMRHISRHEKLLSDLQRATAALDQIPENIH